MKRWYILGVLFVAACPSDQEPGAATNYPNMPPGSEDRSAELAFEVAGELPIRASLGRVIVGPLRLINRSAFDVKLSRVMADTEAFHVYASRYGGLFAAGTEIELEFYVQGRIAGTHAAMIQVQTDVGQGYAPAEIRVEECPELALPLGLGWTAPGTRLSKTFALANRTGDPVSFELAIERGSGHIDVAPRSGSIAAMGEADIEVSAIVPDGVAFAEVRVELPERSECSHSKLTSVSSTELGYLAAGDRGFVSYGQESLFVEEIEVISGMPRLDPGRDELPLRVRPGEGTSYSIRRGPDPAELHVHYKSATGPREPLVLRFE